MIVVLKIMYLALFFSGCNHYKSIHFAGAKIRKSKNIMKKNFTFHPECKNLFRAEGCGHAKKSERVMKINLQYSLAEWKYRFRLDSVHFHKVSLAVLWVGMKAAGGDYDVAFL